MSERNVSGARRSIVLQASRRTIVLENVRGKLCKPDKMDGKYLWLLDKEPPRKAVSGWERLWWAVLRRAAIDLRWGSRHQAMDVLEFFRERGIDLLEKQFDVPIDESQRAVLDLVRLRRDSTQVLGTFLQPTLQDTQSDSIPV